MYVQENILTGYVGEDLRYAITDAPLTVAQNCFVRLVGGQEVSGCNTST